MTRIHIPNKALRSRHYDFVEGSLQNRIRQFFAANPDEELTYPDLCIKFGCTLHQAHGAVRELIKRDGNRCSLESIHVVRGRPVATERSQA